MELRDTGIDLIGRVPWATHFCQFYQSKEDLLDILVPYFKAGLEGGEAGMWVTSAPLTVAAAKKALTAAKDELEKRVMERTADLAIAEQEMRALSSRLIAIQEEERRAIARELHDQVGQCLTMVKLLLQRAIKMPPDKAGLLLSEASQQITELIG